MRRILNTLYHYWISKWCFVSLVALAVACTMQKSGSVLESSRGKDKSEQVDTKSASKGGVYKSGTRTLKTDYLTPVHSIANPSLLVYKERRRLYVFNGDTLVREYPIGLGQNPKGDKEKVSDGRTPEGDFIVFLKNTVDARKKSLVISYPTRAHAERALFQGLITQGEYQDIVTTQQRQGKPLWTTKLGGAVLIHGGGAHGDWTDGSVALYDSDMEELFSVAQLGTPIRIKP